MTARCVGQWPEMSRCRVAQHLQADKVLTTQILRLKKCNPVLGLPAAEIPHVLIAETTKGAPLRL